VYVLSFFVSLTSRSETVSCKFRAMSSEAQSWVNRVQNDEVSDTTGDAICTAACNKKIIILKIEQ